MPHVPARASSLEICWFESSELAGDIRCDCRILCRYSSEIGNRYFALQPAQSYIASQDTPERSVVLACNYRGAHRDAKLTEGQTLRMIIRGNASGARKAFGIKFLFPWTISADGCDVSSRLEVVGRKEWGFRNGCSHN